MNKPIIYFNSLDSLSGNGSIAGTSGHIPAYDGIKDIIAMINNDAYFYNKSVSSWEKINEEYIAGNHINISQNKIIEVSGWENKLDTSAYKETSANIINIIENKVDISAFEIATSSINETIENKISLEEFENLSSSFITINSPLTEEINSVIGTVTANSANWNNDLDTLYSAGPNIDINNNIISSRDWTPELNTKLDSSAFSDVSGKDWTPELNTKLDSSAFSDVSGKFVQTLSTSANWNEAYDTVTANSANWNNDLDTLYSAGPNIDINNNTISSRDWTPELSAKLDITDFSNVSGKFIQTLSSSGNWNNTYSAVNSESANWTKAYDTVTANSANWINDLDALYSAGSNVDITNNTISSRDWTPELNTKLDSTAFTLPTSSNWTKAYDTVTANSASWDDVSAKLNTTAFSSVSGNFLTAIPDEYSTKDYVQSSVSSKLDTTAFSTVSGSFLTAHQTLEGYATTGDVESAVSSKLDTTVFSTVSGSFLTAHQDLSDYATTVELADKLDTTAFSDVSGSFLTAHQDISNLMPKSESANFYPMTGNPSSFLTAHQDLSNYATTASVTAKLDTTAFDLPNSANWDNTYNAVDSSSANWTKAYDTVTANSANWNNDLDTLYSAGSNINITNNTISSKDWTPELNTKLNSTAFSLPTSSNWTKAYETVTANSASWDEVNEYSAGSNINITNNTISSKDWTPELNTKLNSSAFSNVSGKFVQTLEASANWNNVYNTVTTNSANWENELDVSNFVTSSTDLSGSYILSSNGSTTLWSQLDENYDLSGFNGIIISANSANKTIDVGYNGGGPTSEVFYKLSAGQNIGIQSANDGTNDYLIISANANSNVSLPESANWNNTYSTVTNNSANWNSVSSVTSNILNLSAGQNIGIHSATVGDKDYLVISANSNSNVSLPESANWNEAYDTVTANSANWNNDLDTLYSAGPNINITNNTISSKDWTPELNTKLNSTAFALPTSANWTKAYETVTANSANWDEVIQYSAGSNINITNNTISSKDWTPELNAKLNSTAFSNVSGKFVQTLPTSSNWTKAYETVTANSANWNEFIQYSAGSNINITNNTISSRDWTPELNAKLNSTAFTLPTSSNWNNVYNTVTANSASWDEVIDVSNFVTSSTDLSGSYILSSNGSTTTWHELEEEYELSGLNGVFISANSANKSIDISLTECYDISGFNGILVSANSANKTIDITYSGNLDDLTNNTFILQAGQNVVLTSGENGDNKYLTISAAGIESIGTPYELSGGENINITSASIGTNNYLVISAKGGDSLGTPYNLSAGQNIGIQSATDGINDYLVISANAITEIDLPQSANWNNTYSTVNSESANWNSISSVTSNILNLSAGQNIGIQSATIEDTNYLVISANAITEIDLPQSANWNNTYSSVTNNSANWNNTYSTVNSESANWNSVSSVTGNILNLSAGQNIGIQSATDGINDYLVISANSNSNVSLPESANWTKAYDTVTANSANWDEVIQYSAGSNINITNNTISSKDWTPELNTKLNSTAFTLPTSANWNNTYNTVNSESANWNSISSVTSNIMNLSAGQNIGIQSATIGDTNYLVISAIGGGEGATYVAGSNIDITNNTISSRDWTPELSAKLNSSAFSNVSGKFVQTLEASANWTKAYDMVTANSANWNNDLDTLYSAGPNIDITNNTISSKDWTPELNTKLNSTAFKLPSSANWNNTYSTVTNNSANWNNIYSTVIANSSIWDDVTEYSAGPNIDITNNTISSKDWTPELNTKLNSTAFKLPASANWNNTYSTVTNNSADWSGMYSLVAGNSGYWGQGEGTVFELYSSNGTIGISSTTATGNKIIYDISLEGTTTSRNYFINRQEQTDAVEYLPNTNLTLPDLGNGWQIVNGEANYGDIKYTSLSAYSMNGSAYIIPEEVKLASVDIRLDVIIPSGGLSANYQKVEIVIFDDIKNEYIGKYEKWIDISYDRTEQLNFSEIITEPSSVKLYFRSEFACQTYCRTFSLVDLTYKMLLINNNVTGGSVSLPTSANWNNTYSIVTSNSANWNSVSSVTSNIINLSAGQNIGIQSATDGVNDYLVISANSNSNVSLSESANWNNTYNTVTNNSANWNSVSSLSAKSSSILCQNISYTATGSNINVTIPNNTYATISGLNVTGTINVIIPATNVTNGSELNSCAGRLMFSTNKPSTLNFVDSSITSKLPVIGQLPTTYSGTNYQFTCVAGVVACQEIKTIT